MWIPAPISGSLRIPLTPGSKDPTPPSGLCRHALTHRNRHISKKINIFKQQRRVSLGSQFRGLHGREGMTSEAAGHTVTTDGKQRRKPLPICLILPFSFLLSPAPSHAMVRLLILWVALLSSANPFSNPMQTHPEARHLMTLNPIK